MILYFCTDCNRYINWSYFNKRIKSFQLSNLFIIYSSSPSKWSERNQPKQPQSKQKPMRLSLGWRRISRILKNERRSMVKLPMLHCSFPSKDVSLNSILSSNLEKLASTATLKSHSSILFQRTSLTSHLLLNARTIYSTLTLMIIEMYVCPCWGRDGKPTKSWSKLFMGYCKFCRVWIQRILRNLYMLELLK